MIISERFYKKCGAKILNNKIESYVRITIPIETKDKRICFVINIMYNITRNVIHNIDKMLLTLKMDTIQSV